MLSKTPSSNHVGCVWSIRQSKSLNSWVRNSRYLYTSAFVHTNKHGALLVYLGWRLLFDLRLAWDRRAISYPFHSSRCLRGCIPYYNRIPEFEFASNSKAQEYPRHQKAQYITEQYWQQCSEIHHLPPLRG